MPEHDKLLGNASESHEEETGLGVEREAREVHGAVELDGVRLLQHERVERAGVHFIWGQQ